MASSRNGKVAEDSDLALAIQLQAQFDYENSTAAVDLDCHKNISETVKSKKSRKVARIISLLDSDSDDCGSLKENDGKQITKSVEQECNFTSITVLKDSGTSSNFGNSDLEIAKLLQEELNRDINTSSSSINKNQLILKNQNIVDDNWELIDPNPDIHSLFITFNEAYFWGRLLGIEVKWSPKMTVCAGLCCYEGRGGLCSVRLSEPLLKLRPRRDLVQTLLHEMIHAYLFVTGNNKDHDAHGPEFHKHMQRINSETGTKITVYHSFHDEVNLYKQHWWRCDGPCRERKPYYGYVKRTMNRRPQPADSWWQDHQAKCNGSFIKIKEPEPTEKRKRDTESSVSKRMKTGESSSTKTSPTKSQDIRSFFKGVGNSNEKKNNNVHTLNEIFDLDKPSGSSQKNSKRTQSDVKNYSGTVSQINNKNPGGFTKINSSSTVTVTNNKKGNNLSSNNKKLTNLKSCNVHTISSYVTSSPENEKSVVFFSGKGHVLSS